jgi:acetyl esterase/lipase
MKTLSVFVYLSALLSTLPFLRPKDTSTKALLWPFKLLAGALAPVLGFLSGLGVLLGLARRSGRMAVTGFLGATLAARFVRDMPGSQEAFVAAFGPGWQGRLPATIQPRLLPRRWSFLAPAPGPVAWQRDITVGRNPETGAPLLADLWQPAPGTPRSGLGAIYIHGSGWRVGDKDMGTRPFFRRLSSQGHVILDIAYTLWPQADIPTMVREVKQAILWLKDNARTYGLDAERIALMGGSAGGHLALLAAYTPNHPAFQPAISRADTSVRGVVAFYAPTNFFDMQAEARTHDQRPEKPLKQIANSMLTRLFMLHGQDVARSHPGSKIEFHNYIAALLGGAADEIPDTYRLLSPSGHVGPHCPPTLLLVASDDVFGLAPMGHRLHNDLKAAGVPSVLLDLPHTEHAFDLILPRLSPPAQAATYAVERFLALLL